VKKMTIRTDEEKKKILSNIALMRQDGESLEAAAVAQGICLSQYYDWAKKFSTTPTVIAKRPGRQPGSKNKPKVLPQAALPQALQQQQTKPIVAIVGSPADVMHALKELL